MSSADTAEAAVSQLIGSGPFGLGTTDQVVPFQCSTRADRASPDRLLPTAQMSVGETTSSAANPLSSEPTFGLLMMFHAGEHLRAKLGPAGPPPLRATWPW